MPIIRLILAGLCVGTFTGFMLGIAFAWGLGVYAMRTNPDDPTAGSVATIVIATAPVGAIFGSFAGGGIAAAVCHWRTGR